MANNLKDFEKPEYFVNRELSWLKFDERVLSEARDKSLPLFERLKFLSITSSNLDEFYMVRVASLKDQVHAGYEKPDLAGLTPKEQLKQISEKTHDLVKVQYSTLRRSILPSLEKAGLHVVEHAGPFFLHWKRPVCMWLSMRKILMKNRLPLWTVTLRIMSIPS